MKSSIIVCFFAALIFGSCRKEDNPKLPDLIRVPLPLITLDPTGDATISAQNSASFKGKFIVDVYFKNDIPPQKFDIVIIKNGDPSTVKILQAGITTFPTTMEVTGAQITAAFGAPSEGDKYDIGADVFIANGQKIEAFPATGTAYGSSIAGQPGSNTSIEYVVLCGFDKNSFNGNYKVVRDDWQDFAAGDLIAVQPGTGANQISIAAYPSPAFGKNRKPMVIDVDPVTFIVTVPLQVVGDYDGAPPGATVKGSGTVNPCGDKITLSVTINIGGTDYPDNMLILEK